MISEDFYNRVLNQRYVSLVFYMFLVCRNGTIVDLFQSLRRVLKYHIIKLLFIKKQRHLYLVFILYLKKKQDYLFIIFCNLLRFLAFVNMLLWSFDKYFRVRIPSFYSGWFWTTIYLQCTIMIFIAPCSVTVTWCNHTETTMYHNETQPSSNRITVTSIILIIFIIETTFIIPKPVYFRSRKYYKCFGKSITIWLGSITARHDCWHVTSIQH